MLLVYEETSRDGKPDPADSGVLFARATIRHATGFASAISRHRFRREGTVFVQVFVPNKDALSKKLATDLARLAQKAYEDTRGTLVSYKDVAVIEKGQDGSFYRVDCIASFWWEEFK